MIRRAIEHGIIAVALAALVLAFVSFYAPQTWRGSLSPQWRGGCSLFRGRLFIRVDYDGSAPVMGQGTSGYWRWEPRYYCALGGFKFRLVGRGNRYAAWRTFGPRPAYSLRSNLHVPFWLLLIVLAAGPATSVYLLERLKVRRRRKRGLCVKCCYNLTGNISGVCPECGTEVNPP